MALSLGSITAFLTLDITDYQRHWNQATNASNQGARKIEDDAGKIEQGMRKVLAVFTGAAIVQFFRQAVDAASDLSETINKSNTIFGSNAKQVERWGDTSAKTLGLSKSAALEAAAGFGDMFSQIGFTSDEAAKLATEVVQLSADLGSFNNLETDDVANRISAAFRGEYDSLQALIPNINAARVEHEALAATGKDNVAQLTAQEKATAVLAIVTADGSRAIGDFAKTSDGFANSQKILAAEFENTQAAIGEGLMPVAQSLLQLFQTVGIPVLTGLGTAIAGLVEFLMGIPGPVYAAIAAFAGMVIVGQITRFMVGLAYIIPIIVTGMGGLAASATLAARGLALLGGPIVVGLGAVAAAIAFLTANSEDFTIAIGDLSQAIDTNTGKLKANASEIIASQVTEAAQQYVELGGAVGDFTLALSGNEAAQARVNQVLRDAGIAALQATGNYDGVANSINVTGLTAEQAYDNFVSLGGSLTNYGDELGAVGGVQDAYNQGLNQLEEAQAAAQTALEETAAATEEQGAAAEKAAPTVDSLKNATKGLSEAADFANAAVQFLTLTLDQMSGKVISNEQATRAFDAAIRGIGQASRDTAAAYQTQAEKAEASTAAQATLAEKTTALADAIRNYGEGSTQANDAQTALTQATRDAESAQRDYDNATASAADAVDRQFDSNTKAQQSALALATAAYQTAAANGDLTGAAAAATASVEASRAAFIRAQPQADILSGKAEATATALFGIPGAVATAITESGAGNVQGQARGTRDAVNDIPKTSHTVITASVPPRSTIDDYANSIRNVPERKTTIMETIIRNATPGGFTGGPIGQLFPGYARGGRLPGVPPANPYVDNLWGVGPRGRAIRVRSREWLIRQQAADYYGDSFMHAINQMKFPKPQGYAEGGSMSVTPPSAIAQNLSRAIISAPTVVEHRFLVTVGGDGIIAQIMRETAEFVVDDRLADQGRDIQFRRY